MPAACTPHPCTPTTQNRRTTLTATFKGSTAPCLGSHSPGLCSLQRAAETLGLFHNRRCMRGCEGSEGDSATQGGPHTCLVLCTESWRLPAPPRFRGDGREAEGGE